MSYQRSGHARCRLVGTRPRGTILDSSTPLAWADQWCGMARGAAIEVLALGAGTSRPRLAGWVRGAVQGQQEGARRPDEDDGSAPDGGWCWRLLEFRCARPRLIA